jgi:hypothetical protein
MAGLISTRYHQPAAILPGSRLDRTARLRLQIHTDGEAAPLCRPAQPKMRMARLWDCRVGGSLKSSSWPRYGGWSKGSRSPSGAALEVNPNVLYRWKREFRQGPGNGKAR